MPHTQKARLSVWHLHPSHAFDAMRDFNDLADEKDTESNAAVIFLRGVGRIDGEVGDGQDLKHRAFIQGDAHRMTRILGTGRHEQALHGTLRRVDPNPSIAFEDLRNPSPTHGLGDGGTQQGLSWIEKEEGFDEFAHGGRHGCREYKPYTGQMPPFCCGSPPMASCLNSANHEQQVTLSG